MAGSNRGISPVTRSLSKYISASHKKPLPDHVVEKAKEHLLDTIGAIVSGTRLLPGRKAVSYVKSLGGSREACVLGTSIITSAVNAALANGMLAHADETNDFHAASYTHPACSIVPAALATAELKGSNGVTLLKAIVLGYDIACRMTLALGPMPFHKAGHCTHSFGGTFGAAAASSALLRLTEDRIPYVLAYAAQQASGCSCSARDREHIGKAFDFGGMPARNGVTAATMVAHGFSGVDDIFSGERNFFFAYSENANPTELTRKLGKNYEILNASLKKYSVGSVIQAPLESLRSLITQYKLNAKDVERIVVWISNEGAGVVNNRTMPDINLQYLVAVMLLDGKLTFASSHDFERMKSRAVRAIQKRIDLRGSAELSASRIPRQGIVEILTRDRRRLRHHTEMVKGMPNNPLQRMEVEEKTSDLVAPVLGKKRTRTLIDTIWDLDRVKDMRMLRRIYCR